MVGPCLLIKKKRGEEGIKKVEGFCCKGKLETSPHTSRDMAVLQRPQGKD